MILDISNSIFTFLNSTLSSGLNSLAAVTWEDFLKEIRWFREMKPNVQAHLIRVLGNAIIKSFLISS